MFQICFRSCLEKYDSYIQVLPPTCICSHFSWWQCKLTSSMCRPSSWIRHRKQWTAEMSSEWKIGRQLGQLILIQILDLCIADAVFLLPYCLPLHYNCIFLQRSSLSASVDSYWWIYFPRCSGVLYCNNMSICSLVADLWYKIVFVKNTNRCIHSLLSLFWWPSQHCSWTGSEGSSVWTFMGNYNTWVSQLPGHWQIHSLILEKSALSLGYWWGWQ